MGTSGWPATRPLVSRAFTSLPSLLHILLFKFSMSNCCPHAEYPLISLPPKLKSWMDAQIQEQETEYNGLLPSTTSVKEAAYDYVTVAVVSEDQTPLPQPKGVYMSMTLSYVNFNGELTEYEPIKNNRPFKSLYYFSSVGLHVAGDYQITFKIHSSVYDIPSMTLTRHVFVSGPIPGLLFSQEDKRRVEHALKSGKLPIATTKTLSNKLGLSESKLAELISVAASADSSVEAGGGLYFLNHLQTRCELEAENEKAGGKRKAQKEAPVGKTERDSKRARTVAPKEKKETETIVISRHESRQRKPAQPLKAVAPKRVVKRKKKKVKKGPDGKPIVPHRRKKEISRQTFPFEAIHVGQTYTIFSKRAMLQQCLQFAVDPKTEKLLRAGVKSEEFLRDRREQEEKY